MKTGTIHLVLNNDTNVASSQCSYENFEYIKSCLRTIWPKLIVIRGRTQRGGKLFIGELVIRNRDIMSALWEADDDS